jgi:hypothetical protein
MRDANHFHHFANGHCPSRDYLWLAQVHLINSPNWSSFLWYWDTSFT